MVTVYLPGIRGALWGSKIGATVIPISAGNTQRQIEIMKDFKSTVLTCTPSYALYLAEVLQNQGAGPEDINLKAGVFGAEMWTEEMRDEIEKDLTSPHSTYMV